MLELLDLVKHYVSKRLLKIKSNSLFVLNTSIKILQAMELLDFGCRHILQARQVKKLMFGVRLHLITSYTCYIYQMLQEQVSNL